MSFSILVSTQTICVVLNYSANFQFCKIFQSFVLSYDLFVRASVVSRYSSILSYNDSVIGQLIPTVNLRVWKIVVSNLQDGHHAKDEDKEKN